MRFCGGLHWLIVLLLLLYLVVLMHTMGICSVETSTQRFGEILGNFFLPGEWRRIDSFIKRYRTLDYCDSDMPSISDMFVDADDTFFARILKNTSHVLQQYLPERPQSQYNL